MARIALIPGYEGIEKLAIDLFGMERVEIQSPLFPVYIKDLSEDEIKFAEEFFGEYNVRVKRKDP